MGEDRLDEESKAKMKEMLAAGVPLKEVLDKFAKQFEPESTMTSMEKKIQDAKDAAAAEGKELSQAQIFELMKDSMDSETKKKMDSMLKSGMPLDEVIEHFMKKGKNLNEDEVLALMRSQVDEETKKEIAAMLAK